MIAQHKTSRKTYVGVYIALLLLLTTTLVAAFFDLGPFNTIIALFIAICKATLIALVFMHVRWSSKLTWAFAGVGVCWLLLLLGLTMSDYVSRSWLDVVGK